MNSPSTHVPALDQPAATSAPAPGKGPLYWSVRRELWENRSITIAPLIVTAFVLFGAMISVLTLPHRMKALPAGDVAAQAAMLVKPFAMAPAPIMLATWIVGLFYAIDALYGERRDRSILFWKSMPVSDRTSVSAKAAVPLAVLPLIGLVLSIFTQIVMLVASTPILLAGGLSPVTLWAEMRFFQGVLIMIYGLGVHALWFAPIYAWLLLVSAWARRTPLLWATMPLFAIGVIERLAFGTTLFASMVGYRVAGAMKEAFRPTGGEISRLSELDPASFLTAPGLWIGMVFATAFLAAAVRLRRHHEPI